MVTSRVLCPCAASGAREQTATPPQHRLLPPPTHLLCSGPCPHESSPQPSEGFEIILPVFVGKPGLLFNHLQRLETASGGPWMLCVILLPRSIFPTPTNGRTDTGTHSNCCQSRQREVDLVGIWGWGEEFYSSGGRGNEQIMWVLHPSVQLWEVLITHQCAVMGFTHQFLFQFLVLWPELFISQ